MVRSRKRPWTIPNERTSLIVKLTKQVVEEAVPAIVDGEKRARILNDTETKGFALYVGRGEPTVKTFLAIRRVGPRLRRITIDGTDKLELAGKTGARERAKALLLDMGQGINPVEKKKLQRAQGATLRDALKAHVADMKQEKCSEGTIKSYQRTLELYSPDWLDRELKSITRADVKAEHRRIAAQIVAGKFARRLKHEQAASDLHPKRRRGAVIAREGRTGETAANVWHRIARAVYQTALDDNDKLPANPFARLKGFKIERERRTITDLPTWWRGVNAIERTVQRDALKLALFLGLRRGSAVTVEWRDVDLDGATLIVRKPKGGLSRTFAVPLSGFVVQLLRERQEDNAGLVAAGAVKKENAARWVFPCDTMNPSKTGHIHELRHQIDGVEWSPHDCRRVFASVADGIDISRYALAALLNHSQPKDSSSATAGYINIETERLREPMERITAKLLALVEPKPATVTPIEGARKKKAKRA